MNTAALLYSTTKVKPAPARTPMPARSTATADAIAALISDTDTKALAPRKTIGKRILNGLGLLGAATLAVGAAVAGSTVLGVAPWAHADTGSDTVISSTTGQAGYAGDHDAVALWTELTEVGNMRGTVNDAAVMAMDICGRREGGESEDDVITEGMRNTGAGLSDARYDVVSAEYHYCYDKY